MAQAILREYDKERIFKLKPKVGSVIHVDANITGQPGVNLWLLIVKSSQRQVAMTEDLYSTLQELAQRFPDDRTEVLHFPMLDMERGLNHLPSLYAMLDEIFHQSNLGIVLHDRIFVTIRQKFRLISRTHLESIVKESCKGPEQTLIARESHRTGKMKLHPATYGRLNHLNLLRR